MQYHMVNNKIQKTAGIKPADCSESFFPSFFSGILFGANCLQVLKNRPEIHSKFFAIELKEMYSKKEKNQPLFFRQIQILLFFPKKTAPGLFLTKKKR